MTNLSIYDSHMKSSITSKDLILWLLFVRGPKGQKAEPILGRTRLIKMLFLFREEIWKLFTKDKPLPATILPEFVAHHFGPYSHQVFEDLEFLLETGFIEKRNLSDPTKSAESFWEDLSNVDDENLKKSELVEYRLSELGMDFIDSGEIGKLSSNQESILQNFKTRCLSLPLTELLKYVYQKYPKYTTNSKIKDELFSR